MTMQFSFDELTDIAEALKMKLNDSPIELTDLELLNPSELKPFPDKWANYIIELIQHKFTHLGVYKQKVIYRCKCGRTCANTIHNIRRAKKCSALCGQPMTREIKQFMIENDCKPLFAYYKGVKSSLTFKCICGRIDNKKWSTFQEIPRCRSTQCGGNKKKLDIIQVTEYFKQFDYKLLSTEYKGCMEPLEYKCPQGHVEKTTFNRFQQGHRCPECDRLLRMNDLVQLINMIEQHNYIFIKEVWREAKHQKNNDNPDEKLIRRLKFKCANGHIDEVVAKHLTRSIGWKGCRICWRNTHRNKYNDVYDLFEDRGCQLLETEYINRQTKMSYICVCGIFSKIRLCDFVRGRLCKHCAKYRRKKTNQERYGVDNPFQDEEIKAQIKIVMQTRYGVDYIMQNPDYVKKAQETNLIVYGFKCSFQNPQVRERWKLKLLTNYGVDNPMKVPEFFMKMVASSYSRKPFTFPSGRVVNVQGYEPQCLKYTLETDKIPEEDIVTDYTEMPIIDYKNPRTSRTSRYYPDIFIKSQRHFIEVKSQWTYDLDYDINVAKWTAVQKLGYPIQVQIWKEKGKRPESIIIYSKI